jgi:hypothetical protein
MPLLVAFASLPFGLRERSYVVPSGSGPLTVHVSEQRFSPLISVGAETNTADASTDEDGVTTTYTWYDHPFVLRVLFARDRAALGSINSGATVIRRLPDNADLRTPEQMNAARDLFGSEALDALNNLVAAVRRKAHLYHLYDLRRDDIDLTIRDDDGSVLAEDPLQDELIREEEARTETFDLLGQGPAWYRDLDRALQEQHPVDLADELLIEAERALEQRFPRQTIASCHTTIEAAASSLLTDGMVRRGMDDDQIDHMLSTRSLTSKLAALMGAYCGFNLRDDNRALWQSFGQLNDLRNDTVHRGRRPTYRQAEQALKTTHNLLDWLRMVRQRNRKNDGALSREPA